MIITYFHMYIPAQSDILPFITFLYYEKSLLCKLVIRIKIYTMFLLFTFLIMLKDYIFFSFEIFCFISTHRINGNIHENFLCLVFDFLKCQKENLFYSKYLFVIYVLISVNPVCTYKYVFLFFLRNSN
jgi:hypothetical protein